MVRPLVFRHGAAATAFGALLIGWVIFELVMSVRQRWRVGRRWPARDPSGIVLAACLGLSLLAALRLGRSGPLVWPGGLAWPVVVGCVLVVCGVGLRAWSIATLGPFFQYRIEVQPQHHVVTGGPYRYLRHPSYSGIALVLAGVALASGDMWSLPVVAVLAAIGLTVRIRAEERQLTAALGTQYERFAARRKRLIPGVW